MLKRWKRHKINLLSLILAAGGILLAFCMLLWPKETYQGARYGLELWGAVLVPSLLPFFIIAEILLNLGIVKMLGVLLEPLMRPLFNLPGTASFVLAVGFTSGFPMGAIITKRLCEENLCTTAEGERIISFTNNSSPLFILAAVGVGMFHDPTLGIILAISHYASNLLIGMLLGLLSPKKISYYPSAGNILIKSISTLLQAQKNRKAFGKLLGDSIRTGINNITLIGGFIIFFAVLIRLLKVSGLLSAFCVLFNTLLQAAGCDYLIDSAFAIGFWEMTLGLQELSLQELPFVVKAVAGSILLGWSGLSIQAQVTSFLSGSGIRPHLYYLSRILQGLFAGSIAFLLSINNDWIKEYSSLPVFSLYPSGSPVSTLQYSFTFVFKGTLIVLFVLLVLSLLCCFLQGIRKIWQK